MNPYIFNTLKDLAIENPGIKQRFKLAAGIVYRKQLIATGINSYKTHPIMLLSNGYNEGQVHLHAEINAILNALKLINHSQLAKSDLYIVRVKRPFQGSKQWIPALAKPCTGCTNLITNFGIKNVFWTDDAA